MKNTAYKVDEGSQLECRVLLVEDSPDTQILVSHFLKKAGAEVFLSDNGLSALDLALEAHQQGFPFDIILMDIQLPGLDGCEVTKRLREASFKGPIIAFTASEETHSRQKCLEAGCDDYLTKPVDSKKLIGLLSLYLSQLKQKQQLDRAAKVYLNLDSCN
ncbi:Transcriptional activator protein CopR [Gimesia alba]|uniref:Transcriptional activator protein CopR n=1 Tax=Gimesia alba TaxID=2527973 RepID=A0A517RIN6_9PLAN|nr:response regulator [Gimesia alba]QDT43732.1 Transcriptional activator protein CopR [Gimesia alba]